MENDEQKGKYEICINSTAHCHSHALLTYRARRAIRVFLYLRDVTLHLNQELETALPLTKVTFINRRVK